MPRKRHTAEEIVAKLRQVDVLTSQGRSVADAVRAIGVSEVTYYRWRSEFGGLKGDQVKRLKALEAENARLRRAVSDLTLDKVPGRGRPGKLLSPARRRACVEHVIAEFGVPERRACQVLGQHRSTQRKPPSTPGDEIGLTADIIACVGHPIWPLRLPPDHGAAAACGLAGQPQAGGADLAAGGAEGSYQTAKEGAALAQRRFLRPASAGAPEPCLVL